MKKFALTAVALAVVSGSSFAKVDMNPDTGFGKPHPENVYVAKNGSTVVLHKQGVVQVVDGEGNSTFHVAEKSQSFRDIDGKVVHINGAGHHYADIKAGLDTFLETAQGGSNGNAGTPDNEVIYRPIPDAGNKPDQDLPGAGSDADRPFPGTGVSPERPQPGNGIGSVERPQPGQDNRPGAGTGSNKPFPGQDNRPAPGENNRPFPGTGIERPEAQPDVDESFGVSGQPVERPMPGNGIGSVDRPQPGNGVGSIERPLPGQGDRPYPGTGEGSVERPFPGQDNRPQPGNGVGSVERPRPGNGEGSVSRPQPGENNRPGAGSGTNKPFPGNGSAVERPQPPAFIGQINQNKDAISQMGNAFEQRVEKVNGWLNQAGNAITNNSNAIQNNSDRIDDLKSSFEQQAAHTTKEIARLDGRIDGIGAMSQAVTAARPQLFGNQTSAVGMGIGHMGDATALAAGYVHRINENWSANANISTTFGTDDRDTSVGAGVAYAW